MNRLACRFVVVLACWSAWSCLAAGVEKSDGPSLLERQEWTFGPAQAALQRHAQTPVPAGFMFTGAKGTRALLEGMGNPTSGHELGFLAPTNLAWFVVFEFSDTGYIKDDDKNKLDAALMLKSIIQGNDYANERRQKMGSPPLTIVGWEQPPRYNESTHNLEWAIRAESEGQPVVNFNTRLLGRRGVMEVSLVVDPAKLTATLPSYQQLLAGYTYKSGESYAEYRSGDRVAQYGLAALVVGGAAAGAAKLGLFGGLLVFFKKLWKLIVVAIVAVISFFRRLIFGGRRPRSD